TIRHGSPGTGTRDWTGAGALQGPDRTSWRADLGGKRTRPRIAFLFCDSPAGRGKNQLAGYRAATPRSPVRTRRVSSGLDSRVCLSFLFAKGFEVGAVIAAFV